MAPELYASDGDNAAATASLPSALDVYSFGWLLWDLCHDGLPAFGAAAQDGVAQPPALETAYSGPVRKSLDGIWILLQVPCPSLHVLQVFAPLGACLQPFSGRSRPGHNKTHHTQRSEPSYEVAMNPDLPAPLREMIKACCRTAPQARLPHHRPCAVLFPHSTCRSTDPTHSGLLGLRSGRASCSCGRGCRGLRTPELISLGTPLRRPPCSSVGINGMTGGWTASYWQYNLSDPHTHTQQRDKEDRGHLRVRDPSKLIHKLRQGGGQDAQRKTKQRDRPR